jgi:hypothetical protein
MALAGLVLCGLAPVLLERSADSDLVLSEPAAVVAADVALVVGKVDAFAVSLEATSEMEAASSSERRPVRGWIPKRRHRSPVPSSRTGCVGSLAVSATRWRCGLTR